MPTQGDLYLEITAVQRKLQEGVITPALYQKILAIFEGCSRISLIPQLKACLQFAVDRFDSELVDELTEPEIVYIVKLIHLLGTYLKPQAQTPLSHWTRMIRGYALPPL